MAIKITINGLDKILTKYGNIKNKIIPTIADSMNNSHLNIMDIAKQRTPVDTGDLQESGMVNPPDISGTMITSVSSFGGDDVDYALKVHEDLNIHHNVGQAKFLESAVDDEKDSAVQQLDNDVSNLIKTG